MYITVRPERQEVRLQEVTSQDREPPHQGMKAPQKSKVNFETMRNAFHDFA